MKKIVVFALFLIAVAQAYPQDVSFKLVGGMTWVQGDDYNKSIAGVEQLLRDTSSSVTGHFSTFKYAPLASVEILTHWGKRIAVGLGGGYYQMSLSDQVTSQGVMSDVAFTANTAIKPQLSVIPFYINVYYKFKIASAVGLNVFAGPAFQIIQFSYNRHSTSTLNSLDEIETFKAASPSLGYQAGLSLNVRITPSISFVADGFYRYGKATKMSGNWLLSSTSASGQVNKSSSTYLFWTYTYSPGASYPAFGFYDSNGPSGNGISGARRASVDLTGVAIVAGLKIDI
jgi:hypothetical protein